MLRNGAGPCAMTPVDISLNMSDHMEGKYDQGPIYKVIIIQVPDMSKSQLKAEIGQVSAYVGPA